MIVLKSQAIHGRTGLVVPIQMVMVGQMTMMHSPRNHLNGGIVTWMNSVMSLVVRMEIIAHQLGEVPNMIEWDVQIPMVTVGSTRMVKNSVSRSRRTRAIRFARTWSSSFRTCSRRSACR